MKYRTLGELYDALKEIEEAEKDVAQAELSLRHGGNEDTMRRKRDVLEFYQGCLAAIRDEEIGEVGENS